MNIRTPVFSGERGFTAPRLSLCGALCMGLFLSLLLGQGVLSGCTPRGESNPSPDFRFRYEPAREGRKLEFPRDHGAHRESAYEWWYFTGHVLGPSPTATKLAPELAGFQLTVFRISPVGGPFGKDASALRPDRASYLIAHLAISDLKGGVHVSHSFELRERVGVAGVSDGEILIRMPGLEVERRMPGERIRLRAAFSHQGTPYRIEADVVPRKPLILHGQDGFSRKGPCTTCASHYSSYTRLEGSARVAIGDQERRGTSSVWFDHEFGSNTLELGQAGWDWFSVQLQNGWDLMFFQLRDLSGKPGFVSGTWVSPDGKSGGLPPKSFRLIPEGIWRSPHSNAPYPATWRVKLPPQLIHQGLPEIELVPKLADQEVAAPQGAGLATYWEGSCTVRDSQGGEVGRSYVEMTGYDPSSRPSF